MSRPSPYPTPRPERGGSRARDPGPRARARGPGPGFQLECQSPGPGFKLNARARLLTEISQPGCPHKGAGGFLGRSFWEHECLDSWNPGGGGGGVRFVDSSGASEPIMGTPRLGSSRQHYAMLRLRGKILEHRGEGALGSTRQCCGYGGKSWNAEAGDLCYMDDLCVSLLVNRCLAPGTC